MNPRVRKLIVALVAALLTMILTQEEILELGLFQRLELASIDYRFRHRPRPTLDSSDIVIVEVSDESFKSLPERWPWPRSYYAHLVRNLKAAGAKAVGVDIILNGSDTRAPRNDDDFRAAIRETGIVVLAGKMDTGHEGYEIASTNENFGNEFYPVDRFLGLVNVRNDADGVYRRYSPYWERIRNTGDTLRLPTFSFAVLNKFLSLPWDSTASNATDHFLYAGRTIPKYDPSSLLINFYGSNGTFRHVKFADVLDDQTTTTTEEASLGQDINTFSDPEYGYKYDGTFKNKIVLVGSTTPEEHDLFPVSIAGGSQQGDNLMYGVEIHANVIESVLHNQFLLKQSRMSEILLVVFFSLLTFYLTSALRSERNRRHFLLEMLGFLFVLAEVAIIGVAAIVLFGKQSYVLATVSPMIAVFSGYIASTGYHFVAERKQRLMIKDMFSSYVSPVIVEELLADPGKLELGGKRKELTVLFSDIEGFTTISEKMRSEQLVGLLNEYFAAMTGIILEHLGTLDKFFGDAVIAFWGAPLEQEDHALRACTSALEMQEMLALMRSRWQGEGKPLFRARIGINTGEMIVGNMGGAIRGKRTFNYTVIGDSVNIASRLEGANKAYKTGIMVSEATYELVKHKILGRELDLIAVKGRSEPLRTFELIQSLDRSPDPELRRFLASYSEGLHFYRSKNWHDAEAAFREALKHRPDYPTTLLIERAGHFRINPPPEDWNGVFELTSK